MPRTVTIAFDVMGSDRGPAEIVRGAAQFSVEAPHLHALLVGDTQQIDAALACARSFELLPGVRRAAASSVFPTRQRHGDAADPFSLILDVGASAEATAEDLVAFAVMGAAFARVASNNREPTVALLSTGSEPGAGPARVVEAYERLRGLPGMRF